MNAVSSMDPASLRLSRLEAGRAFARDPLALLERAAKLGDVVAIRTGWFTAWLLNHPDLVWHVLATHSRDVKKGPTMEAAARMLGRGLLTSEGEHHHRQRRLIQPAFHHDRLRSYEGDMRELVEERVAMWEPGIVIDVREEMARLALSIVARSLFGEAVDPDRAREIGEALTETLAQYRRVFSPFLRITEHLPIPATRRFARARETFDGIVNEMIEHRRRAGGEDDLLTHLLQAQEDGKGMTDAQVRDEVLTLFLAGHETTAVALTWTFWLLAAEPDVVGTLHEAVDGATHGDAEGGVVDRVIAESMRLRPPAWAIGRRVLTDLSIENGVVLPAGNVVVVSPWLLHHDRRWWPDPDRFDLGRWEPSVEATRPRHAYLPFGGGPRMCIGEGFARQEAGIVLSTVTRSWRLVPEAGQDVRPKPAITLRPNRPVLMRLYRR